MKRNAFFLIILMLLLSISAWATVFSSGTINLAIPDNTPTGVNSTISVPDAGDVLAVKVGVDLTHTYDGDLSISLTHGATTVILFNHYGGTGENLTGTIFDDTATTSISSGTPPYTGSYIPYQALAGFTGINNSNGDWILNVADNANIDTGILISWYMDITIANPIPMVFTSCTTTQNTAIVFAGDTQQPVIGIDVVMTGSLSPHVLTQFTINATGTTAVSEISNAKIFYTGTSATFAPTAQFGSTVVSPTTANFLVTGTQVLSPGTNHFWLTYDVSASAVADHVIDGVCNSLTIVEVPHVPTITAPTGARTIKVPLAGTKTVGPGMTYTTMTAAINDLNTLGIGLGGVIFSVTSGATFTEDVPIITATGAVDRPITFQKSSTSHAVLKPTGTSGTSDAGIAINGGDYITFDGIDIIIATGNAVEYGFYLYGGAQNNTIKNSIITLLATNTSTKAIYSYSAASTAAGANSYNKFYNNVISNCYSGVYLSGSGTAGAEDTGNELGISGGTSSISSYGLAAGTLSAYGYYGYSQKNAKVFSTTFMTGQSSTGSVYSVYSGGSANTIDIYSNTIRTLTTSSTGYDYGVYIASGTTANIYSNTIRALSSATGYAYAVYIYGGTTNNIYKNTIYDIFATGAGAYSAYGIYLSGGTTNNVYNNMIRTVAAVSSTSQPGAVGIFAGSGTNDNLYYNTIFLNQTATAASVYSAALYTTSTPTSIDIRNNIFVNKSAVGTAGKAVAFWRSISGYTNIAAATNNNLYFAGTPGALNLIHYNGTTNYPTLAEYKTVIATKDQLAVTEDTPFISATNLHLSPTIVTQAESGGTPITTPIAIIGDIDGDTGLNLRSVTTPDIGADEGTFAPLDITPPNIIYTVLGNTASLVSRTLSGVTITDATGLNVTSPNNPRIYYKKSTDANVFGANNSTANGWKWTATASVSSPFTFTLNYSLLQTAPIGGETIQYFVVAQDVAATINVASQPVAGFAGTSVSAITSAPTTPNSYLFIPSLSGIKTVGTGGTYPTITAALAVLNVAEITGALEYRLLDTDYSTNETFPLTINANPGFSAINTLTIKPAPGVTGITISGTNTTAIWYLTGASYVTISGYYSDPNAQDLTITNKSTTGPVVSYSGDAAHNVLTNCLISGSNASTTSGLVMVATSTAGYDNSILKCTLEIGDTVPAIGVYLGGTATGTQKVQNCNFRNMSSYGIYVANSSSNGIIIDQNTIRDFGVYAIYLFGGNSIVVSKCDMYSNYPTSSSLGGMYVGNVPGVIVKKCKVHDLVGSSSATLVGFYIWGASSIVFNMQFFNNEIYLETGVSTTTGSVRGIDYFAYAANSCDIWFNSVYIGGTGVTSGTSYAMYKHDSATTFRVENNVFMNARSNSTGTGKHYAVNFSNVTYTTLLLNHNDYYVTGTGGVLGYWSSTDQTTLAAWRTASGQDLQSINTSPTYSLGANYLRPFNGSPVFNAGVPISGITDDILDGLRSVTTPTLGAYETGINGAVTAPVNFTVTQAGLNVILGWNAVSGASSYKVYSSNDPYAAFGTWTFVGSSVTNSYTFTPPYAALKFYRVTAVAGAK